jgi:hypothetical protein
VTLRGVDEYFPFIFDSGRGIVMPIIAAYFDESVRPDGTEPICVAGFLFKAADYTRFKNRWHREVLRLPDKRRLKHLHATDLCAGQGEFKGLSIPERVAVLDRAVKVLNSTAYAAISVMFEHKEFASLVPEDWAQYRGSMYSSAAFFAINAIGYWLRHDWNCHLDVLYVFERGYKHEGELAKVLMAVSNDPKAKKDFRYRNHLFEDKDNEPGLQAADLLAWTCTKACNANGKAPKAVRPFVPGLLDLAYVCGETGRTKLYHLTGDSLKRFLHEQAGLRAEDGYWERAIQIDFGPRKPSLK